MWYDKSLDNIKKSLINHYQKHLAPAIKEEMARQLAATPDEGVKDLSSMTLKFVKLCWENAEKLQKAGDIKGGDPINYLRSSQAAAPALGLMAKIEAPNKNEPKDSGFFAAYMAKAEEVHGNQQTSV